MYPSTKYPALLGALLVLNWPLYVVFARLMFRDKADLKLSILSALKPPILIAFRDWWPRDARQALLALAGARHRGR